jgi:tetratricopeptide (TPR) repeat protein
MSDPRYDQYREALRLGHLATQRERYDAAAAAYREATRLAPDRALPLVGLGGALAKLGRTDEAIAAFAAALDRAPDDTVALAGRADALAAAGRRSDAADDLDRLSGVLEHEGRMADACDAARRALELAEARGRRRQLADLAARVAAVAADDPLAAAALERALAVLESVPSVGGRRGAAGDAPEPPPPDPLELTLAVEEALETGDLDEARRRALAAAAGHRAVGQFNAAMDACYQALAIEPSDPEVHLLLAELYLDRGWRGPAADKLVLLGRLSRLTGDDATRTRLCELATARLPDDARFTDLCA